MGRVVYSKKMGLTAATTSRKTNGGAAVNVRKGANGGVTAGVRIGNQIYEKNFGGKKKKK